MSGKIGKFLQQHLAKEIQAMKEAGTYKAERIISSPQLAEITANGRTVLNFCANNYLGLSNHPRLIQAAKNTLDSHGFGMSSVRFICGTQDIHKKLEGVIADYYSLDDSILFPSGFDANAGFFEAIFGPEDAVISDALNHASIIDGIRLCKAQKFRFKHLDMADLEESLKKSQEARMRLIVTDGVFSMDGDIAPLDKIYQLAQKYNAYIYVDECHAAGFIGKTGKGTPELFGLHGKIDFISSTLGKSMGGASGGFVASSREVVEVLRNRARTYLFSNSIAPAIVGASLEAYKLLDESKTLINQLNANTALFRTSMKAAGFRILGHDSCPIAPVWLGDARLATELSNRMLEENIFVIGFSFPVVPKGEARIRVQLSAGHSQEQVTRCV
jgi:glycine C-acetyltransferase